MRIVTWTIRLVLFLLLIALAAKNIEPVTLNFYFGVSRQAPLIVILFGAFAIGALFGMLALLGTLLRQRREISILRKSQKVPAENPLEVLPPVPPL
jgi:lipopolysaccharide assembly protein A